MTCSLPVRVGFLKEYEFITITEYYWLGSLNNTNLFLPLLGGKSPQSSQLVQFHSEGSLLGCDVPCCWILTWPGQRDGASSLITFLIKTIIQSYSSPLVISCKTNYLQWLYLNIITLKMGLHIWIWSWQVVLLSESILHRPSLRAPSGSIFLVPWRYALN